MHRGTQSVPPARGVWGHAPQEKFGALRLILMQSERDNQS